MTPERIIIESMLRIPDKQGNDVDFKLNTIQQALDATYTGRDIITKFRQPGISSYILARFTIKCLAQRNVRAVVISHDKESTQRMLAKVHYYLNNIKGPAPVIKNESKNELTFAKTNSAFYLGTAGARKFGRGDTITHLHCSEVAYWPDPEALTSGLFQAVPMTGEVALESTGNGAGNFFHKMVMKAAQGRGRYRLHFFSWKAHEEYTLPFRTIEERATFARTLDPELGEPELVKTFDLTMEQLAWRRMKLEELNYDLARFEQEYPLTLDQCFQASGNSLFVKVLYLPTESWRKVSPDLYQLDGHPRSGFNYMLGGDVGAGVGKDNSVLEVFCLETLEQVAEWASNRVPPDVLAQRANALGRTFNEAFQIIESNNHGILTLAELDKIYPRYKIYRSANKGTVNDLGHRTSVLTKPMLIGQLRAYLATGWTIHSPLLKSELSTFVEREDGKLAAQEGCLDDRVIAAAKAAIGFERAMLMRIDEATGVIAGTPDPFSLEGIVDELRGRALTFPIAPQASSDASIIDI